MNNFDGNVPEFKCTYVGEQKILAVTDNAKNIQTIQTAEKRGIKDMPYPQDNWEVKDVYVIDVMSKDPKYPQSKKRLYIDKENVYNCYYAIAWDRAGKLWKIYMMATAQAPLKGNEKVSVASNHFSLDLQFGVANNWHWYDDKVNGNKFTYADFTPAALIAGGR